MFYRYEHYLSISQIVVSTNVTLSVILKCVLKIFECCWLTSVVLCVLKIPHRTCGPVVLGSISRDK